MSSYARVNMLLIASKGLLPKLEMEKILRECLEETRCSIVNKQFFVDKKAVGTVLIGDRIVVQTLQTGAALLKEIENLRKLYTLRAEVAYKNYCFEIEQKQRKARQEILDADELARFIRKTETQKQEAITAHQRQEKAPCIALKEELISEAESQGYDVIDQSKEEICLQFVKREY